MARGTRRSYRQFCGLAKALDVVGERWTLLVVRELLLGPRRYGELLAALPGITTNLLAKRLKELSNAELVTKTNAGPAQLGERYALTAAGLALEPCVMELARWGGRYMAAPVPGDTTNIGWALLSMKRRYRGGSDFVACVQSGSRSFELSLTPERLGVQEKASERAELTIAGESPALFDFLLGKRRAAELEHAGKLAIDGSRRRLRELSRAFGLPC